MPASYLPYLPDQDFLLPHSMREWLPDDNAVRANLDADAKVALADAGYRSEAVFEQLRDHPTELGRVNRTELAENVRFASSLRGQSELKTRSKGHLGHRRGTLVTAITIAASHSALMFAARWMPDQVRHDKIFCRADP